MKCATVDQSVKTIIRGGRSVGFTNWILMILNEAYRLDSFERNWEEYVVYQRKMDGRRSYVPPAYVPLGQSDSEAEIISRDESHPTPNELKDGLSQWSSGICACCDDMQSCFIGLFCPCYLFGKNAELLGSRTMFGSCTTHFILWALMNTVCCLLTDGVLWNVPGCFLACYACGYRKALRSKYNLPEAPCGDFVTHFFCHFCAICQEYREIRERAGGSSSRELNLAVVTPPTTQTMESNPET